MTFADPTFLQQVHGRMLAAARRLRLPLSGRVWRGRTGNWAGAGIGSSIDFQDHRPYLPGDDPRYINWQAFARSGHYTMKLYREEVSPQVDLVLDTSASMFFEPGKRTRSWELLYFCRESCLQTGASLRVYLSSGDDIREAGSEELATWSVNLAPAAAAPPALASIPWRPGSLRVLISDLLFPSGSGVSLLPLAHAHGRGILFVVHSRAEAEPDWNGNLSLVDCETGTRQRQFVSAELLERYRQNYARHFDQWQTEARRHNILFARVPAEGDFVDALQGEPIQRGAVESWG
jgi:uncharacterized protein (DUF58 family)